ncbi:hypothetical protein RF11_04190 [Thelohanellus kitauei]|uniref:Tc1-like transposase DDE domain-containing protein n=1 Tax=Thelohanellus kitauei TaxID=669202 RepID=A0A0C2N644_THEKT|nr:hypothetical protein RF11_04190 [Thelohanellus kitauei]
MQTEKYLHVSIPSLRLRIDRPSIKLKALGQSLLYHPLTSADGSGRIDDFYPVNLGEGFLCLLFGTSFSTIDVMYMDETGFNFDIRRSYGLSQRVQPRNRTLTNSRGRNIKVNAALNVTGIIHYWYNEPRITKPSLCHF